MPSIVKLIGYASLLGLGACSTITVGDHQPIQVTTQPTALQGCTLANTRESVSFQPPATVTIKRSMSDLYLNCADASTNSKGGAVFKSDFESHDVFNIFTLGLGMIVDWTSGAAYKYPDSIDLPLNQPINPEQPVAIFLGAPTVDVSPDPVPMIELTPTTH